MTPQGFSPEFASGAAQLHLVEEINHRVVNEYAEAISSLSLAARAAGSAPERAALAFAAGRLRAHAETHKALLPPVAGGVVSLTDYVAQICASLSQASLAERGVHITMQSEDIWLGAGRCWRVGLIVTELVRNAARHGLHRRGGSISVRLLERSGRVSCLVCDNGPEAADPKPGRGRQVVEALARELAGSIGWWFTPLGCVAHLQLPSDDALASRAEQHPVSASAS
jgi:two-component sensor histidine kinase